MAVRLKRAKDAKQADHRSDDAVECDSVHLNDDVLCLRSKGQTDLSKCQRLRTV